MENEILSVKTESDPIEFKLPDDYIITDKPFGHENPETKEVEK